VNADQLASGRLGLVLALVPGNTFAAGTEELVKVNFRASGSPGNYSVGFADQPVTREVSDSSAVASFTGSRRLDLAEPLAQCSQ
jgi:hypothetical protein